MELFKSSELKSGNYYKVSGQSVVIKMIDKNSHVRISYCRLFGMRIGIERNTYLNEDSVYEILSEYSFNRVRKLLESKFNQIL